MKVIEIIIPVYNALEYVDICIRSVFKYAVNNDKIQTNVTVIDDCSNEYVAKYLDKQAEKYANYKVLHNEKNIGFVKSCNRAMRQADADIIVLLNSDTVVTPHYVEKILNCFESDPKIGIASPISTSSPNMSIRMLPGFNVFRMAKLIDTLSERRYPDVVTPEGFCFCIRKDVIEKQDYFDEIYGMGYGEESDYSMLAIKNGFRTACIDDLYIYHKRHATFSKHERDERNKENRGIFEERWLPFYKKIYSRKMAPNPIDYLRNKVIASQIPKGIYCDKGIKASLRHRLWMLKYTLLEEGIKTVLYLSHKRTRELFNEMWRPLKMKKLRLSLLLTSPKITKIKRGILRCKSDLVSFFKINKKISLPRYPGQLAITFFLPDLRGAGGVISVVNLANELLMMGVDVSVVATTARKDTAQVKMLFEPIFFKKTSHLMKYMPAANFNVATLWTTAFPVNKITKYNDAVAGYFIQDHEVNFVKSREYKARIRKTYDLIEHKFAKTKWLAEKMDSEGHSCHKINPGMDLNIFYPLKRAENSHINILAMNRNSTARRGSKTLLESLKIVKERHPDVNIQLFGECTLDADFDFVFLGRLSHKELADCYRKSDIYIDASSFHGFGRPGVEALACGCALVSTDSGGIREYAVDGENCLLARVGDSEDVAEKIMTLINDKPLRETLQQNGMEAVQKYAEHIPAKQFLEWADSLITSHKYDEVL